MIRIIHLSDFHLNKKILKDWNNYMKDALTEKLQNISQNKPINFIAFTGDLIDEGGKDFGGAKIGLEIFKKNIIDEIATALSLEKNEFLIIPGNHDIDRSKDQRRIELGNSQFFQEDYSNISEFMVSAIEKNDFSGMERIQEYKEFEKDIYDGIPNSELSIFGNSFKLSYAGIKVGIACLNSAWRCYGKNDAGSLIVGEDQLLKSHKFISSCDIKIALLHHPLDWLILSERDTITNHLAKDFDLLLLGHVHESKTTMTTGFTGTLFTNISPSGMNDIRSDSRQFSNGFTVIDFDNEANEVSCHYWRYNHSSKEFVLNTDLASLGVKSWKIPNEKSKRKQNLENTLLSNIKEDHYKVMDDHLIGTKAAKSSLSIKEAFIMPPINQGANENSDDLEDDLNIAEIVKSKSNFIFFGDQECGKTTLLYRLVREFVDEYTLLRKIPVYLDFNDLGNKEIITVIKEYLRCGTEEAKNLVSENSIVLLIDNLYYKKHLFSDQRSKIHNFNKQYEGVQILATSENLTTGILQTDYIELCKIPFRNFFIKNLRAKEIKCIMKQWLPDESELSTDKRLERLVENFRSYALPSTAMSVSLFLWSMEYSDRKPINNAVLMEIYIEIVLEKLGKHNVYRENFDFTNKIQLLAKIAQEMLISDEPNYSILFSDFESIVEKYLEEVGFQFEANMIVNYFLERKIFIKHQHNRIRFSYSCFFHFFIAKRMIFNPEFKVYILDEKNFFKFPKEIDYYSGLSRSDEDLLEEMLKRLEQAFTGTDFILEQVNIDQYFTLTQKPQKGEHEPLIEKIEIPEIKGKRPSTEMLEEFYNKQLEKIPKNATINKKHQSQSLEGMLIIMANVLRNSEGVENRILKRKAFNAQVKYSMIWMILYKEYLVEYLKKNKKIPPSIPSNSEFIFLIQNLPLGIQQGMNKHMGTTKLSQIILDKLKEDLASKTTSDIETFFSVMLYSDIEGKDFPKYLKGLIKKIGKNAVRDFSFLKLLGYYYRRTRPGSPNEKMYLDLLAELKIKTKKLPYRMKDRVMKALEDAKKTLENK